MTVTTVGSFRHHVSVSGVPTGAAVHMTVDGVSLSMVLDPDQAVELAVAMMAASEGARA